MAPLLLALLLWFAPGAQAGTDEGRDALYDGAVSAFREGRYEEALAGFLRLRALGAGEPELHFNIGSSYYRLGRYRDAETAFLAAARDPGLAGISYYNLALTAYRRGDDDAVRYWIERLRVIEAADGETEALSEALLERLDAPDAGPPGSWSANLLAEAGYNDNVTLQADSETLGRAGRGDAFMDLFGRFDYRPGRIGARGLLLEGGAYVLRHHRLRAFDTALLHLAAEYEQALGPWQGSAGVYMDQGFLDGRGFTRTRSGRLEASRALGPRQRLQLAYEIGAIREARPEYRYLSGTRHQVEAGSVWRREGYVLRLFYRLEHNDRRDVQEPFFTSFSPLRHEARTDLTMALGPHTAGRLGLTYRHSRYADPSVIADGVQRRREDGRLRLAARFTYTLGSGRDVSLEVQHTVNDSNIRDYEYRQTQCFLSVLASW